MKTMYHWGTLFLNSVRELRKAPVNPVHPVQFALCALRYAVSSLLTVVLADDKFHMGMQEVELATSLSPRRSSTN
jgi:hypothetical protein